MGTSGKPSVRRTSLSETATAQRPELVASGDVSDLRGDALEAQRLGVELDGHVEAHLRQLQRHKGALAALFELGARALRGDLVQILVDALDGAELFEEVGGTLGSDAPHAG